MLDSNIVYVVLGAPSGWLFIDHIKGRKNRKIGITQKCKSQFLLFFDILCKIVYSMEWAKK